MVKNMRSIMRLIVVLETVKHVFIVRSKGPFPLRAWNGAFFICLLIFLLLSALTRSEAENQ